MVVVYNICESRAFRNTKRPWFVINRRPLRYELYILIIDEAPKFKILGFVNSTYVLGQEQWKTTFGLDRPFCYSIPPEKLTPIELLKNGTWN